MKKSEAFKGLPVVDIEEGTQLGRVRELVIHPHKRDLMALLVEDERWWKEIKAISFPLISGIGEYAVTVQNRQCLVSLSELPEIEKTLEMRVHPIGSNVITRSGVLIGKVNEFFLDPKDGKVKAYQLQIQDLPEGNNGPGKILPSNQVLTLGRDIVVVADTACEAFVESTEEIEKEETPLPKEPPKLVEEKPSKILEEALQAEKKEAQPVPEETKAEAAVEKVAPAVEKEVKGEQPPKEEPAPAPQPPEPEKVATIVSAEKKEEKPAPEKPAVPPTAPAPKPAASFSDQFIQRVKQTLLGKTVKREVLLGDGTPLVKPGDRITEETLEKTGGDRKVLTQLNFAVK